MNTKPDQSERRVFFLIQYINVKNLETACESNALN